MRYVYYWNMQKDEKGRFTTFDGFREGDPLCIADSGEVADVTTLEERAGKKTLLNWAEFVLDRLFEIYNTDLRPAHYRGPSMSVGSVIQLGNTYFTVEPVGYKEISSLSASPIVPAPSEWRVVN